MNATAQQPASASTGLRAHARPLAWVVLFWAILQLGGLFTPGLLDDVDSIYIEIAREMLHRHDFVTPVIDGVRFFDKPPLMYWMAAGSMSLWGEYDWAARLPLALSMLALLVAVYGLGLRFFAQHAAGGRSERGALYATLAFATAVGPYLYTRFFIPDILLALWMTLAVHLFLTALDRAGSEAAQRASERPRRSALLPSLGFGAVLALNLLTKGLIGIVFPLGFAVLYLFFTQQMRLLRHLHAGASALVFAAIALPWHVLAALRNPPIAMPAGQGLPAHAGWAWFYLYNEHVARFLGRRIPHDYGQTPVWLFWVYAVVWIMPWAAFLPPAVARIASQLGHREPVTKREREAALSLTLWSLIVLVFFTLSSRQEYYSIPALPALALMAGGVLAREERMAGSTRRDPAEKAHRYLLLPLSLLLAAVCGWFAFAAPRPAPGADLAALLASNPELYNLSLGHLFDLTGAAMGLFRAPLLAVAVGFVVVGPVSLLLRRRGRSYAANLTLAAGMTLVLLAAHEGLVRFNPILGSKTLAQAIVAEQARFPRPDDLILIDGELTAGSTLLFYTRQPVHLVNGRVNGPWFGGFWPDAPAIFEDDASLKTLWAGTRRVYLLTYNPRGRTASLSSVGPVRVVARAGGKTILTNHPETQNP